METVYLALYSVLSLRSLPGALLGLAFLTVLFLRITKSDQSGSCRIAQQQKHARLVSQFVGQIRKQLSSSSLPQSPVHTYLSRQHPLDKAADTGTGKVRICCPGGGMFFFWQIGVCKWLQSQLDLSQAEFVGCSSGALVAVLCATGCDLQAATEHAFHIARENNLWERPLGLAGCWGGLIRQWLDDVLPDNAANLCRGRVSIITTQLWSFQALRISHYTTKQELIDAVMASVHVPFFMDWQPVAKVHGQWCLDGHLTFPPTFGTPGVTRVVQWPEDDVFAVDHHRDVALGAFGVWDFLRLKSTKSVAQHVDMGYEYAARMWGPRMAAE